MRTHTCPACSGTVYFDNLHCNCGQELILLPAQDAFAADAATCGNRATIGCNWAAEADAPLCLSCAMTTVHPDPDTGDNADLWRRAESAKRWTLAGLLRWGWFTPDYTGPSPEFHLLSERTAGGAHPITMGHADGIITINVTEASDSIRTARQEDLSERYRTMIGHFRHEIAHFLFMSLGRNDTFLSGFRKLFGDERQDYAAALERHYAESPRLPGPEHISAYAAAHPHEDWAETAAHLEHMTDLLDSAAAVGLSLSDGPAIASDVYAQDDADIILTRATAVALAVNHVNRSLDIPDLYPFVFTDVIREKLSFAHSWLRRAPAANI